MNAAPSTSSRAVSTGDFPRRWVQARCPNCLQDLPDLNVLEESSSVPCPACRHTLRGREGIWRALAPGRQERFRRFVEEYEKVRAFEGRGSPDPNFYLKLPYRDSTGRNQWQWNIRGRSFRFFENRILPEIEKVSPAGLDVLDLGAGNCWMSNRLATRKHRVVAVDLSDNLEDGLGAARHYLPHLEVPFVRFQAEMDRLPFQCSQFDLTIFNASFHYSEDYRRTLGEALRCLRRPGYVVIIDSPFYKHRESGDQMVKERRAEFVRRFGFASDSLPHREYLTAGTLRELADAFQFSWQVGQPWYGLEWALRPLKAALWRRREPSKFFILWGKLCDSESTSSGRERYGRGANV